VQKLQNAHQVLQVKLRTDARTHKQALAAAARERHQLEQQLEQLQQQLEQLQQQLDAKEKEARASALAAKQAQRKLEEVKGSAAKAVAGVNARVAEAVAAEAARHKQVEDARVHLMLCIIHDPDSSSSSSMSTSTEQQPPPQPQQLQQVRNLTDQHIHSVWVVCRSTGSCTREASA
jgi:chromosome segregation ATPase